MNAAVVVVVVVAAVVVAVVDSVTVIRFKISRGKTTK